MIFPKEIAVKGKLDPGLRKRKNRRFDSLFERKVTKALQGT